MKKFLVSVILCALVITCFTMGRAHAEDDEKREIIKVTINIDGSNPEIGECFEEVDYFENVTDGEGFTVDYCGWATCEERYETEFRENCRYKYEIKISPEEGYFLDEDSSITINGVDWSYTDCSVTGSYGNDGYIQTLTFAGKYDIGIQPFYETEELKMSGVCTGGEQFPHVEIPDDAPYEIVSEYWIDDGPLHWKHETDGLFQYDTEYEYKLTLKLDPGYYATNSSKVNIDSEWIEKNNYYDYYTRYYYGKDGSYYLVHTFMLEPIHNFEDDYLEKYNEIMLKVKWISGILISAAVISLTVTTYRKNRKRKTTGNAACSR